jgi:hypothetical protein
MGHGTAQPETLRLLLQNDACPTVSDHKGNNPLHLAAQYGRLECARALLSDSSDEAHQAMTNSRNCKGQLPLELAAPHPDVAVLLSTYVSRLDRILELQKALRSACQEVSQQTERAERAEAEVVTLRRALGGSQDQPKNVETRGSSVGGRQMSSGHRLAGKPASYAPGTVGRVAFRGLPEWAGHRDWVGGGGSGVSDAGVAHSGDDALRYQNGALLKRVARAERWRDSWTAVHDLRLSGRPVTCPPQRRGVRPRSAASSTSSIGLRGVSSSGLRGVAHSAGERGLVAGGAVLLRSAGAKATADYVQTLRGLSQQTSSALLHR